ncbi:transposase [Candidatus Magnetaquicoccus inordinatus]|uniref:transposase n=1 Tax=Candidatus Magnetaquicoccus inordinatus TaxID=2496818 RepID=UPI001D0E4239|nr:transposase [Candidatus Magnetaquicoccus inordinatus]
MFRHPGLYTWVDTVASHFPQLSKPQALVLALWSFGMTIAKSCALGAVADSLATLLGRSFGTMRERLRDMYREAGAKSGQKRDELDLNVCWAPWLTWVLKSWSNKQVAIAIDATTLGERFVVLAISVLYRGCAVPVAWKILSATGKHPWEPEWLALLKHFKATIPPDWTVIVLADRGLYAKWLFLAIIGLGWHPLLRINQQGTFRRQGRCRWTPLTELVPSVGRSFAGHGTIFQSKKARLECVLLARWDEGYKEAWLVLTDLPPHSANVCWYGLRAWIEQGFKRLKRGGWQWQYTRMEDPARAERVWLALALATWWLLSVGGEAEASLPVETMSQVPGSVRRQRQGWRLVGIFRHGWNLIMAALLNHQPIPLSYGVPEPWPILPKIEVI